MFNVRLSTNIHNPKKFLQTDPEKATNGAGSAGGHFVENPAMLRQSLENIQFFLRTTRTFQKLPTFLGNILYFFGLFVHIFHY